VKNPNGCILTQYVDQELLKACRVRHICGRPRVLTGTVSFNEPSRSTNASRPAASSMAPTSASASSAASSTASGRCKQ